MTGCRCNSSGGSTSAARARSLAGPSFLAALALFFLVIGIGICPVPASAQSAPTELTPAGPPASPLDQPGVPPQNLPQGAPAIEAQPLPLPTVMQPLPAPGPGTPPAPGQPAPGQPAPGQPVQPQPQPASIGADLGPNLWLSSDPSRLMARMPGLPAPVTVPALRDLQLRLLTTAAKSSGVIAGSDLLLPFRADRLNAMGFSDAALALTRAAASVAPIDPQGAVEQSLTAGDAKSACDRVDAETAKMEVPNLFWRKALILCQLTRRQADQAQIGLDLLREMPGRDQGTANFLAVAAVATGDAKPNSIKKPIATADPVLVALMKLARLPAPAPAGAVQPAAVGPAAWVVVARDGTQPVARRIDAGERAYAAGLIPIEELIALYQLAPPEPGDPVAEIAASDSPLTRAGLYQATAASQLPEVRARFIAAALQRAHGRGDYFAAVALYAPFVRLVQPSRNLAWLAPEAARAMFLTGDADRGQFWLNLVNSATGNPDLARAAPGLRLLARLARGADAGGSGGDPVAAWRQATGAVEQQAAQLYAIFAGLGQRIGGWNGITPIMQNGSYAAEINAAALAGRRGETVLLSLAALGGDRLGAADPASLAASLGGLTAVGLGAEARRIALAAAVLVGL